MQDAIQDQIIKFPQPPHYLPLGILTSNQFQYSFITHELRQNGLLQIINFL